MKNKKVLRSLIAQASVLAILLVGLCAAPSKSSLTDSMPSDQVTLPGVHGAANNTVYARDRYIIVAPFAPSVDIGEGDDLAKLDNHFLYLFDTRKPGSQPKFTDLKIHFPTKVVFDPETGNVFVHGTEFVEVGPGQFETRAVIAHTHLNFEADGKPSFGLDSVVPIHIPGLGSEFASEAPTDIALAYGGRILVFTNGHSVFTYNVSNGAIYSVGIDSKPDNKVSFLDIDEVSNTVIAATSRRIEGAEGGVKYTSDLYFIRLDKDGTLNTIKRLLPEHFGEGVFLSAGSNAAVSSDPITGAPEFGYFVTNNGGVCQVDLRAREESTTGVLEQIALLPEMAQDEGLEPGPVSVRFDRSRKMITVVKQGGFLRIRIPSFVERGGRIRIPSFTQFPGSASIAVIQLNKKNRVIGQRIFDRPFGKENRISNMVAGQSGVGLISTHSGRIFAVDTSVSLDRVGVNPVGEMGSRIDRIAYSAGRQSLTAIVSYTVNGDSQGMLPGSILFAKVTLNAD
ncbi:MAG TPA: hypothetical protein VKA70_04155 [Blastocatellia bacterium]|nr:hypothetical protein [Blastocatellia bacterium]